MRNDIGDDLEVLCLQGDSNGGCGFYRIREPARVTKAMGFNVSYSSDLPIKADVDPDGFVRILDLPVKPDVIVIQRATMASFFEVIKYAQNLGIACVVEIDDDLTNIHPNNMAYKKLHPKFSASTNYEWLRKSAAIADLVVTSTPQLAKVLAPHGRFAVLRNAMPESIFNIDATVGANGTRLGWSGTLQTHPSDFDSVGAHLGTFLNNHDGVKAFHVVGDGDGLREAMFLPKSVEIVATGWVPQNEYMQTLSNIVDVGIVPLELTPFNHSKCLDAETLITTKRGIIPIRDVVSGDFVSSKNSWKIVQHTDVEEKKEGLEIETKQGRSLKLSKNHRLLVNGDWMEASKFSIGDKLNLESSPWGPTEYISTNWPADSRMTRNPDKDRYKFNYATNGPTVLINEDWGKFLGLFTGDGCLTSVSSISISFDNKDQDMIDWCMKFFESLGLNPSIRQKYKIGGKEKEPIGGCSVSVNSAHMCRFLESLGVATRKDINMPIKGYSRSLKVPDVIFRSPKSVVASFLSSYFEADGWFSQCHIGAVSKDKNLLQEISHLLLSFDISAKIIEISSSGFDGKYLDRTYYRLIMVATEVNIFTQKIRFLSNRKNALIDERKNRILDGTGSRGHARPSVREDEIISITSTTIIPVDIQVDGQEFSVGGITSHNSALKMLEMSALGIPSVVSPTDENLLLSEITGSPIARRGRDWVRHVKPLMTDYDYFLERSAFVRESVRPFTYENTGYMWIEAWKQAAKNRREAMAFA